MLAGELADLGQSQLDHLVSALLNFSSSSWLVTGFQDSEGTCTRPFGGSGSQTTPAKSLLPHPVDPNKSQG